MNALFVAQTADASCYHRAMLPAKALGADWCGLDAPPPRMRLGRGEVSWADGRPDLESYDVVVVQSPTEEGWPELIAGLQAGGTRVLCDLDFDLHGFKQPREPLARLEALVASCDGVLCATERIAERYARLNPRVHLCPSGLDLGAYGLSRPAHDTINIGWAGRSLGYDEMRPWIAQVVTVMRARAVTNFISIGEPAAEAAANSGAVEPERCLSIPVTLPEQYPAALTIFDISFDPLGRAAWRRARSPLRWLEAAARGIPFVGDRRVYPFEHGRTGFHAGTPESLAQTLLMLVDDAQARAEVGGAARRVLEERYTMQALAPRWAEALAP